MKFDFRWPPKALNHHLYKREYSPDARGTGPQSAFTFTSIAFTVKHGISLLLSSILMEVSALLPFHDSAVTETTCEPENPSVGTTILKIPSESGIIFFLIGAEGLSEKPAEKISRVVFCRLAYKTCIVA